MNTIIDYSKINFYFPLFDDITTRLVRVINDEIKNKDNSVFIKLEKELDDLIKTSDSVSTCLPENTYTVVMYRIILSNAYLAKVDVTPIISKLLINNDIKNILPEYIENYYDEGTDLEDMAVVHDIIKQQLVVLKTKSELALLKIVVNNGGGINEIKLIAKHAYDSLGYTDSDLDNIPATLRTLVKFGGTLEQARDLIKKRSPVISKHI